MIDLIREKDEIDKRINDLMNDSSTCDDDEALDRVDQLRHMRCYSFILESRIDRLLK